MNRAIDKFKYSNLATSNPRKEALFSMVIIHLGTAQFFPRRQRTTTIAIVATATRSRAPAPAITEFLHI